MSTMTAVRQDVGVATGEDPHGLRARMAVLGLLSKDVAERLGIAPNTVTRAVNTREKSDARPRIDALLTRLEEEQSPSPAPFDLPQAARKLAQLAGEDRLVDARIEFIGDGKVQRLVALLVDSNLSREEVEREIREWRKGYDSPE